jgi:hypothetical protein
MSRACIIIPANDGARTGNGANIRGRRLHNKTRRASASDRRRSLGPRRRLTSCTRTTTARRRGLSERTSASLFVPGLLYSYVNSLVPFARRANEGEFLSSLTDSLLASTTWSRICELIDLQNSQSKTVTRPGFDPTRYREVLPKLRMQGDKASSAAG